MLSSTLVGLMFAVGSAAWVYDRTMRRTGGNTKNALMVAAAAGVCAFILIVTTLALVGSFLEQ